jgi:hypothetical protein
MQYYVQFPVGGLTFGASADSVEELLEHFGKMGGDSKWLLKEVMSVAPGLDSASAPVNVTTRSAEPDLDAAENLGKDEADAWSQNGPWGGGSQTDSKPQKRDPWTQEPVEDSRPAQRRSAPSRATSDGGSQGAEVIVDRFGREFALGLPEAPNCDHGEPAARMKAKSQAGKRYTQWVCAKAAGDDYKQKCDFKEWPN